MKSSQTALRNIACATAAASFSFYLPHATAAEKTVSQKGKAFSVEKLTVKVGDSVKFLNQDPFSHNIFSLSDVKSFDLGTYPQGKSKSVTFDKPGTVDIECAIHPNMQLTIEVKK